SIHTQAGDDDACRSADERYRLPLGRTMHGQHRSPAPAEACPLWRDAAAVAARRGIAKRKAIAVASPADESAPLRHTQNPEVVWLFSRFSRIGARSIDLKFSRFR